MSLPTEVRIYRPGTGWRVLALVLAALLACDGLMLLYWSTFANLTLVRIPAWAIFTAGLLAISSAASLAIMMMTSKAIHDAAAVEIRCAIPLPGLWFGRTGRTLRSDIAVKSNFSVRWPTYVLYPKGRTAKKLAIWVPKQDDYFRNWIAGIPDVGTWSFWNRGESGRKP
jgi:hypothetical protein